MRTEYENMVKEFLPALRASAAKRMLEKRGMKQEEIADMLGTTQASVSKYLSGKYSDEVKDFELGLSGEDIEAFIKNTANGDGYEAQRVVCRMCSKNLSFKCGLMIK